MFRWQLLQTIRASRKQESPLLYLTIRPSKPKSCLGLKCRSPGSLLAFFAGVSELAARSVFEQLLDPCYHRIRLRQNHILELGLVGAERIDGRDSLYRRIQLIEQLVADASRELSSVTPTQHVFIGYDHAMRLAHRRANRIPVIRRERTQIQDLRGNSLAL